MTAQEALNAHPAATVAYVNKEGEWHFSTPPNDFEVVETLTKGEVKSTEGEKVDTQKGKHKKG